MPTARSMSATTAPALPPPEPVAGDLSFRSLALFFALVFAVSWSWWLPLMLMRLHVLPTPVPMASLTALALPGVLAPSAIGLLLAARRGRRTVRELLASLVRWRFGAAWWGAVVLQPAVLLLVAAIVTITGIASPQQPVGLTVGAVATSAVFLLIAATGEEVGWRGVALPALLRRRGPLVGSLVLGVLVAVWHLPYWVLQGVLEVQGPLYLVLDLVFVVALTYQLTWLYLRSRRSVLAAVAFHVSFNIVNVAVLLVTEDVAAFAVLTVVECGIAAAAAVGLSRRPAGPGAGS